MNTNNVRMSLVLALVCALFASANVSHAVAGYSPIARGRSMSCYYLDNVNGPITCHRLDTSAEPESAPFGSPEYNRLFELRYGPCTLNGCVTQNPPRFFKRWQGTGAEATTVIVEALRWACKSGRLAGGLPATSDCTPTRTEVTDAQATGDPIWRDYLVSEVEGWSAARPHIVHDSGRPNGATWTERNPFWGLLAYFRNSLDEVDPPVNPPTGPPAGGGPLVCAPCPVCVTCEPCAPCVPAPVAPCAQACPVPSRVLAAAEATKSYCKTHRCSSRVNALTAYVLGLGSQCAVGAGTVTDAPAVAQADGAVNP